MFGLVKTCITVVAMHNAGRQWMNLLAEIVEYPLSDHQRFTASWSQNSRELSGLGSILLPTSLHPVFTTKSSSCTIILHSFFKDRPPVYKPQMLPFVGHTALQLRYKISAHSNHSTMWWQHIVHTQWKCDCYPSRHQRNHQILPMPNPNEHDVLTISRTNSIHCDHMHYPHHILAIW